jgi:hypothetical protein
MSVRHATISAWQRHEEGGYSAEIDGWTLVVKWHPESDTAPRGFSWTAEKAGQKLASEDLFEEIELAMASAEEEVARASAPANEPEAPSHAH